MSKRNICLRVNTIAINNCFFFCPGRVNLSKTSTGCAPPHQPTSRVCAIVRVVLSTPIFRRFRRGDCRPPPRRRRAAASLCSVRECARARLCRWTAKRPAAAACSRRGHGDRVRAPAFARHTCCRRGASRTRVHRDRSTATVRRRSSRQAPSVRPDPFRGITRCFFFFFFFFIIFVFRFEFFFFFYSQRDFFFQSPIRSRSVSSYKNKFHTTSAVRYNTRRIDGTAAVPGDAWARFSVPSTTDSTSRETSFPALYYGGGGDGDKPLNGVHLT